MSRGISHDDYVSLLEDAVSSGPSNQKPAGDRFSGMQYKGMPNGADKILNWEGLDKDGDLPTDTGDSDVNGIVENLMDDEESPMSMLEMEENLLEASGTPDPDADVNQADMETLDIDDNLSEAVSLSSKESEILSRLINEMSLLESDDNDEDDNFSDEGDVDDDELSDLELELSDEDDNFEDD